MMNVMITFFLHRDDIFSGSMRAALQALGKFFVINEAIVLEEATNRFVKLSSLG